MSGVLELSLLFIALGVKGFTGTGLPFSSKTNLTGPRGRSVGAACLLLGFAGITLALWASDPAERSRLWMLCRGIVLGVLGTVVVFGQWRASEDDAPLPVGEDGG